MKTLDLVSSAVSNTFRSKTRTILTVLAIFVGAFTLTITNGLGTGINLYIDQTVSAIGASDVLTVTKPSPTASTTGGPTTYDPNTIASDRSSVTALTAADITALSKVKGVTKVQPTKTITTDFIQNGSGTKYDVRVGALVAGQTVQLKAGKKVDSGATQLQLDVPKSYVKPLGFSSNADAVGKSVTIAITDGQRVQHLITATIVGVADGTFAAAGSSITPNTALTDTLFAAQNTGVPVDQQQRYAQASVWFDSNATSTQITQLQTRLTHAGYTSQTVAQQLGTFKTIIDAIVLVLNAFAVIALLAASFGIVNTLLMSVQERTREIGLMKAMGMSSGRVFGLFSLEAVFIGLLGSALGAGIGILAGTAISSLLSGALLATLPGLSLIAFNPLSIAVIILVIMGVAFLAGTLPAARAGRADPVESLRYE
jgi:putative ABC transport system permease protein